MCHQLRPAFRVFVSLTGNKYEIVRQLGEVCEKTVVFRECWVRRIKPDGEIEPFALAICTSHHRELICGCANGCLQIRATTLFAQLLAFRADEKQARGAKSVRHQPRKIRADQL